MIHTFFNWPAIDQVCELCPTILSTGRWLFGDGTILFVDWHNFTALEHDLL